MDFLTLLTCSHLRSRDKRGCLTIQSAVVENPLLHASAHGSVVYNQSYGQSKFLVHLLPHLFPFLHFSFFRWLYLFSSFVHPFPGFSLCFVVFYLCYLYSLVKMNCGVLFYLV